MRMELRGTLFLALSLQLVSATVSQEIPGLHAAMDRFAESRQRITSYHVELIARVKDRAIPQKATDGNIYPKKSKTKGWSLEIIMDQDKGKQLILANSEKRSVTIPDEVEKTQTLRIETPEFLVFGTNGKGSIFERRTSPRECCEFDVADHVSFDPLSIGLGFAGDLSRGENWRTIVRNYQAWPPRSGVLRDNGTIRYGSDEEIESPDFLVMDPERDFSPVLLKHRSGSGGTNTYEVKVDKLHGHWLPSFAKWVSPELDQFVDFQWHSVNDDVGHAFEPKHIEERYNLRLTDRR